MKRPIVMLGSGFVAPKPIKESGMPKKGVREQGTAQGTPAAVKGKGNLPKKSVREQGTAKGTPASTKGQGSLTKKAVREQGTAQGSPAPVTKAKATMPKKAIRVAGQKGVGSTPNPVKKR